MISATARALSRPDFPSPYQERGGREMAVVSGFQGADAYNDARGYVYFPTLDTRRELDSFSRYELTRRSRFLYNNVGLIRRVINGISRMVVGRGIRPRPKTRDAKWNRLALADFNNTAGTAGVFDIGGRYNFFQAQRAFMRGKLKDGNAFSILAKTASGLPAMRLFESHQVGNGSNDFDAWSGSASNANGNQWIDGVLVNRSNRRIAYRILGDGDTTTSIDAADIIAFCDLERPGQVLGAPCTYHAINNTLDIAETIGFLKQGIKQASLIGYQVKNATRKPGLGGAVRKVRAGAGPGDEIRVEEMFRGGKAVELEPGAELALLSDTRPHPNALGFFDYLIRDIAWGVGMSPEIIWDIAKLGGANTRFIIADAQEYVEEQQDELIEVFCKRYWVYQTAVKLNAGILPPCEDPEWWQCDWIRPRKLTVDRGKDGKLYIELQGRGMLSLERWYGEQGQDWEVETRQVLREKAWIKKLAASSGLSLQDIFSTVSANSIQAPPPTAQDQPVKPAPGDNTEDDPDSAPDPEESEDTDEDDDDGTPPPDEDEQT
jgi:capsid protein